LEFFRVLEKRRSVREYSSKPVEEEKLARLLEAVNSAPSAGNLQAYKVYVVKDEKKRKALAEAALNQEFVAHAPICLVFFSDPRRSAIRYGERGATLYCVQDATIAATFAMLTAVALGLSTVWVGAFDDEKVNEVLAVSGLRPVAILPIGYCLEEPPPTPRRPVWEIFELC
jgi:nitroreductase